MLTRENMWPYQVQTAEHIKNNLGAGCLIDMGLGKTVSTATAILDLIMMGELGKVLIVAPKRVAESTWPDEFKNWSHLTGLKISTVLGTQAQRLAALKTDADVYTTNYENIVWLLAHLGGRKMFDMLVLDESSRVKNPSAQRTKALKKALSMFERRVILTGTPVPNGYIDLWSQIYMLDKGKRLGETITNYRAQYFRPDKSNGHIVYSYALREKGYAKIIQERISDMCISMKAKDYLQLPDMLMQTEIIKLQEFSTMYEKFERDLVMSLPDDEEITAFNTAALRAKLRQFCSGAIYNGKDEKDYSEIHTLKIDALNEIVEDCNGSPILVFYEFQHTKARIEKRLAKYKPRQIKTDKDIKDWNEGKITLALGHPASIGHGLNLQFGGHRCIWFDMTDNMENYEQANRRLLRQGQRHDVVCKHLVAELDNGETIDHIVLKRTQGKIATQDEFMEALKARIINIKKSVAE